MFKKVLIANRGEIAVRVMRTLRELGIGSVAVYSEPDRRALHVAEADEAWPLPGVTAAETYLQIPRLIEIALASGAEAVHPGYGFLSENAAFAQACQEAGLVFLGPSPAVIRAMGDKVEARRVMLEAGVPVVPGWEAPSGATPEEFLVAARALGFPVLVKATAGGGGKGMRRVERPEDLTGALEAASREAGAAFGNPAVYLEKYLHRPRHVEIQIFGDAHGRVVHLWERECSLQRRHQKILEESPSPVMTEALRERMGEAARRAAAALGYQGAGTVEFLLDEAGDFYFLEVNTRLQVEHPVTEAVLGLDLVRLQLEVGAGLPLPFTQEEVAGRGHAIEVRIYAEDPDRGFLPAVGTVLRYRPPEGPGIRVDAGVEEGTEVTVHYDPMLAKVIAVGSDRAACLERLRAALDRFVLLGLTTNLRFLRRLLDHPEVAAGRLHTHLLEDSPLPPEGGAPPLEVLAAAALADRADRRARVGGRLEGPGPREQDPWSELDGWRVG